MFVSFAIYIFGIITGLTLKVYYDWIGRKPKIRNEGEASKYPKVNTRIGKIIGFDLTELMDMPRNAKIALGMLCGIAFAGWFI